MGDLQALVDQLLELALLLDDPRARAVDDLEATLVGELPGSARVRELCAAWLANPTALVVGLIGASSLADAIARSARVYSTSGARSSSA